MSRDSEPFWSPSSSDLPEPWRSKKVEEALAAMTPVPRPFHPDGRVFRALDYFPPEDTKVVILGQDPYPQLGKAIGLAFGVGPGFGPDFSRRPDSLLNIARLVRTSTGEELRDFSLESWARQGVLLLNASLSVASGEAGTHRRLGWKAVVQALLTAVHERSPRCAWLLWGGDAHRLCEALKGRSSQAHLFLETSHPSPMSASQGFLASRAFAVANEFLGSSIRWGEPGEGRR